MPNMVAGIIRPGLGVPGIGRGDRVNTAAAGQVAYTSTGTHTFVVPAGVYSISAVTIGRGDPGGQSADGNIYWGGSGGGLAYANQIPVTPGESLTVAIQSTTEIRRGDEILVGASGASTASNRSTPGNVIAGTGYPGGSSATNQFPGAGAGGYTSKGEDVPQAGGLPIRGGSGSSLLGGGEGGKAGAEPTGAGGTYGGGGQGARGAGGARIIWPGPNVPNRAFPQTNTSDV